MEVYLTPAQRAFLSEAIRQGRLHGEEEAVQQALLLWEERERKRAEFLITLEDAKASIARGDGREITEQSMRELADEIKRRGLARLNSEHSASRE
jgi:Arc/MetJ-type ribon-helix-helix transcriptional regulator